MATIYEFAIKKDVLNSGKNIFTPVCRKKSKLGRLLPNPWMRITFIYDQVLLMELDFIPDLTYKECEIHIKAYQDALIHKVENQVATIEFHTLEELNL